MNAGRLRTMLLMASCSPSDLAPEPVIRECAGHLTGQSRAQSSVFALYLWAFTGARFPGNTALPLLENPLQG